jgi:hypothetical protein
MPRKLAAPARRVKEALMINRLTTALAAAALALTPVAVWSQTSTTGGAQAADRESPAMQKPGKVQKDTDPRKNGTSQSQSTDGMNKNGKPQK